MADEAPLTVDAALGLLDAGSEPPEPEENDAPAAESAEPEEGAGEPESEAEPTAEDDLGAEEPTEDAPEEPEEPAEPAIPAPHSWDAEAREVFSKLPREAQQVIAARESARDAAVTRATQEAAETRKRAEQEVQGIAQLRDATQQVLTKAQDIFKGKWDGIDWPAWAQQDPAACFAARELFAVEQQELQRLQSVQQAQAEAAKKAADETAKAAQKAFQAQKAEAIKTLAPELVDPVKGPANVRKLEEFLVSNGIDRSVFPTLDAFTIALAYDGWKYRQAKTTAPKQTPAPTRPAVRPAAAQAVRSPQRATQEAKARFNKTLSIDDALAVLSK